MKIFHNLWTRKKGGYQTPFFKLTTQYEFF